MPLQIGLIGSSGKMGQRVLSCILKDPTLFLTWELSSKSSRDPLSKADVIIDFSTTSALHENILLAEKMGTSLVVGTTGLQEKDFKALREASLKIPVLWAPNFSLGVAILVHALKTLSPLLQKKFTPSIEETHHIHKKYKPSGTALALAEALQTSYKTAPSIESFRQGEMIGDHSIFFLAEDEIVTLRHESLSRDAFALGALEAAKFLVDKPAGFYNMQDLL